MWILITALGDVESRCRTGLELFWDRLAVAGVEDVAETRAAAERWANSVLLANR